MTSLDPSSTNSISTPSTSTPTPSEPQSSFVTALYSINPLQDFAALPSIPCARYSLLFGILAGASVGSLRFIFARSSAMKGASRWSEAGAAANWAVGAWGVGTLGAWETCRRRQTSEASKMSALVAEVKSRRQQRPAGSPGSTDRIGGVLIGEKGRELVKDRKSSSTGVESAVSSQSEGKEGETAGKSWYRKLI